MSSLAAGGEPRTIDAPIDGPAVTQTFVLPKGVTLDVEAVYIEVNAAGAGGPVTAELTISESSGVVIAKKRQSAPIDPGGAGSATWALRLGDDGSVASGGLPVWVEGAPIDFGITIDDAITDQANSYVKIMQQGAGDLTTVLVDMRIVLGSGSYGPGIAGLPGTSFVADGTHEPIMTGWGWGSTSFQWDTPLPALLMADGSLMWIPNGTMLFPEDLVGAPIGPIIFAGVGAYPLNATWPGD